MYSFHITCPITLTYSELNNYSVLNDRAHLQKKLNEQKENGKRNENADSKQSLQFMALPIRIRNKLYKRQNFIAD